MNYPPPLADEADKCRRISDNHRRRRSYYPLDSVDVGTMKMLNKPTDNIQDDDDDIDDADDYCYRNRMMTMVRLCRPFDD